MSQSKLARLAGMVQFVTNIVMADDGVTSSEGGAKQGADPLNSQAAWHFGFYSRPMDGARGVVLKADGQGNTSFLFCYRDKQYELSLEKGEVALAGAFSSSVLLDKNGNVTSVPGGSGKVLLGAASGTQPAVLGNALQTRLADLEAKFLAHTHVVAGTCPTGGGPLTAGLAAVTTSALPHAGDVIRSSNTEVSP